MREECRPIGKAVNPALCILSMFACAETEEEAQRRAGDGGQFFAYSLNHYYSAQTGPHHEHGRTNLFREFGDTPPKQRMAQLSLDRDQLAALAETELKVAEQEPENENARALWRAAKARSSVGTPDQLRNYLGNFEDAHQDVMLFVAQVGSRKHEDIMASIDLFGRKVLPDMKERHETIHRPWRERQLQDIRHTVRSSI